MEARGDYLAAAGGHSGWQKLTSACEVTLYLNNLTVTSTCKMPHDHTPHTNCGREIPGNSSKYVT